LLLTRTLNQLRKKYIKGGKGNFLVCST